MRKAYGKNTRETHGNESDLELFDLKTTTLSRFASVRKCFIYMYLFVLYTYALFQPILSKNIMKGQNVRDDKCKSVFSSIAN